MISCYKEIRPGYYITVLKGRRRQIDFSVGRISVKFVKYVFNTANQNITLIAPVLYEGTFQLGFMPLEIVKLNGDVCEWETGENKKSNFANFVRDFLNTIDIGIKFCDTKSLIGMKAFPVIDYVWFDYFPDRLFAKTHRVPRKIAESLLQDKYVITYNSKIYFGLHCITSGAYGSCHNGYANVAIDADEAIELLDKIGSYSFYNEYEVKVKLLYGLALHYMEISKDGRLGFVEQLDKIARELNSLLRYSEFCDTYEPFYDFDYAFSSILSCVIKTKSIKLLKTK